MNCPFCAKEMQEGKIQSARDTIRWDANEGCDAVVLSTAGLFNSVTAQAFYCPDRRRLVVEVPEYESLLDKLERKSVERAERRQAQRAERESERTAARMDRAAQKKKKSRDKDPWEV